MAMAWCWANQFPTTYCEEKVDEFVIAFIDAWLSGLIDVGGLKRRSFAAREKFIND